MTDQQNAWQERHEAAMALAQKTACSGQEKAQGGVVMFSIDQVSEVLADHPLVGSPGGSVICNGCRLFLGDPAQHLLDALQRPLTAPLSEFEPAGGERDRRESQIVWVKPGGTP